MSNVSEPSITAWIGRLQTGDPAAAQKLWERYFQSLVRLARQRLRGAKTRAADEEDVVQEAFDSFFRAAQAGRFPQLHDRDDLWQLLVRITENKALDQRKQASRQKRGGGQVRGHSIFAGAGDASASPGFDGVASAEPTPDFAAETIEQWRNLLAALADPQLEQIALLKMQGHTHEEIADRLGVVPDTIGRKLKLIRAKWEHVED